MRRLHGPSRGWNRSRRSHVPARPLRKQSSSDEWIEAFCDLVLEWKPVGWAEEKDRLSAGVGPALDKRQRERKAYCYRQQFPTKGDKAVRAQSIRGRMALEGLYVHNNASW